MNFIHQLEKTIAGWVKDVPHLPLESQRWLGRHAGSFAIAGVVLVAILILANIVGLLGTISLMSAPTYAAIAINPDYLVWSVIRASVVIGFLGLTGLILAAAVKPLRARNKKGWVLLFALWLLMAASVLINSILTLSAVWFITSFIFGGIFLALGGYLLFEIHGQFAHAVKKDK